MRKNYQAPDSANTTTAPAAEVPFVDGKRSLTVNRELKPRGKGGDKDDKGTKVDVTYTEINSLDAALPAILEVAGNDSSKALEIVNAALQRAAVQNVYDATFGDEIKIRGMIRSMVAAGIAESVAEATARDIFAKAKGETVSDSDSE